MAPKTNPAHSDQFSPYRSFSIDEWAKLRCNTKVPLTEAELIALRGINERASLEEVAQVYLPLSRLLSLYVESVQQLNNGTQQFMGTDSGKVPFIIGVAGSVAVGKSTVARILQTLLARWPEHPRVELITTDGFLLPTAELQKRNLMHRKGFPESFDRSALLQFLSDVKGGRGELKAPVYSHLLYDVVADKYVTINQPDILVVEGLNVLQTGKLLPGESQAFVSDYFDFSIYIDAEEETIRNWYVERFLKLRDTVFRQENAYFSHYAELSSDQAIRTANEIWASINLVNLRENILPTRERAKLIIHKGQDHAIDRVRLRKL
ncbi:MAG: type I pantothenate kinase [Granulosicoccus sp.]